MLAFRSLDPFRALREPDRRRRDEERLSRSEQRTLSKTQNNHLTGKAPYKFESGSLQRRVLCELDVFNAHQAPAAAHVAQYCWVQPTGTARSSIRSSGFGTICAVTGSPTRCFPAWRTSWMPARWRGTDLPTTTAWSARSAQSLGPRLRPLYSCCLLSS